MKTVSPIGNRGTPKFFDLLLATSVLLSAYLLFQVQPLMSKYILPWFGGSPSVWTTAMLFFQCLLFAGYAYAHLVTKLFDLRKQAIAHIALMLLAAVAARSIVPPEFFKPNGTEEPVWKILLLLSACVGMPYFCLSTTGPLLQYWFGRSYPGRSPYRLYSLSNAGSFLALLSFPYLFEPLLQLPTMAQYWSYGFWIFAGLCILVGVQISRLVNDGPPPVESVQKDQPGPIHGGPSLLERLGWVVLPAIASLAFIATTDRVSHDVAPEPRLWITTLSLYLLTFIICFDHERWYHRRATAVMTVIAILLLVGGKEAAGWVGIDVDLNATEMRWSHFVTMFLVCFVCHGELVKSRPKDHKYLTDFYLWMSFGGACGGLFVALVATNFFNDYYEWALCLVAAGLVSFKVMLSADKSDPGSNPSRRRFATGPGTSVAAGLLFGAAVVFFIDPLSLREHVSAEYEDTYLHRSRNFYGTIGVKERRYVNDPSQSYRVFYSGQIIHGAQFLQEEKKTLPTSYYGLQSGVGETLEYMKAKNGSLRVGLVGLGIGTLASYARPSDHYDFYEINPQVVEVANTHFDTMRLCQAASKRVILGDARLKLDEAVDSLQYDVLVLDAFSGGSVPIHLLTEEAFSIYKRHLKPEGFIVLNITNAYLNLYPVVKRQADELKMGFRYKFSPSDSDLMVRRARYAILTNDVEYLSKYPTEFRRYFDEQGRFVRQEDLHIPGVQLWTDHFSSINAVEIQD